MEKKVCNSDTCPPNKGSGTRQGEKRLVFPQESLGFIPFFSENPTRTYGKDELWVEGTLNVLGTQEGSVNLWGARGCVRSQHPLRCAPRMYIYVLLSRVQQCAC